MNKITLTEQQLSAVEMVKKNRISVLSGGPGCGKTTTTKEIIAWAHSRNLRIIQAAPTGKAAKRMTEATGVCAGTIHATLGCEFIKNGFQFIHNQKNPLNCDLLIMDEVSMITNALMYNVLQAVDARRTRVLLVGDQDQLPSVGPGAVLRDMLNSKVFPCVELDVVHRNAGTIVTACHKIKNGIVYSPPKALDLDHHGGPVNLVHVECDTPEQALAGIEKIVCDRMPLRGYDPVNDVQVISPVNEKGELSCKSINARLRDRLNQAADQDDDEYPFRPGDKVINTKNETYQSTGKNQEYIVNGDIGFVDEIQPKNIVVSFKDPERQVVIPKKQRHLLHAYCITCHRFQGSEAPVIIIPVHRQFDRFLSNPWIYTAISRGKDIVITVGRFQTISTAIKNKTPNNRNTKLTEGILHARQKRQAAEYQI